MNDPERIADQLHRAFDGPAWHGPALMVLLHDVNATTAAAKPLPGAHSIWEIVRHLTTWHRVPVRRMDKTNSPYNPSPEEDWPSVQETNEATWAQALADLRQSHAALTDATLRFPEHRLGDTVPGQDYSFYVMLHGIVQHDLYHAGQIALLKKPA